MYMRWVVGGKVQRDDQLQSQKHHRATWRGRVVVVVGAAVVVLANKVVQVMVREVVAVKAPRATGGGVKTVAIAAVAVAVAAVKAGEKVDRGMVHMTNNIEVEEETSKEKGQLDIWNPMTTLIKEVRKVVLVIKTAVKEIDDVT